MKYFSLLMVAGVLLFSACKNGNNPPKTAKELMEEALPNMNVGAGKFTIETPKGWKRADSTINGVMTTILLAPEKIDGFTSNVNIVTEKMDGDSLYFEKLIAGLQQYVGEFKLLDKGEKNINGISSRWLKYTSVQQGRELAIIMYVVPKDSIAYGITGVTTKATGDKYFAVFDSTVSTFKVKE